MSASLLGRHWTWRSRINATLVLLICAGLVAFLGIAIVSNFHAASDAVQSLNTARRLTSARITKLNTEIAHLSAQDARAERQRGVLIAEVKALTQQLRALGAEPVVNPPSGPGTEPGRSQIVIHPHPTVTRTMTSHPRPSPRLSSSRPSPTPTPKPSPTKCRTVNLPIIGCP